MTFVSGCMIYGVIWWVVLFVVLPFGIKIDEDPQKGTATSAPENPKLFKKFATTTVLASFVWAIVYYIMRHQLIQL